MAEFDLPRGQYFSLSGEISTATGGQTRALLLRNRLFATKAGVAPIILTFDRTHDYREVRAELRRRGELVDPVQLTNIHEYYRETNIDDLPVVGPALRPIDGHETVDVLAADGSVTATAWIHPHYRNEVVLDHRRPDGSVYLRTPGSGTSPNAPPTDIILTNSVGEAVGRWPDRMGWRQNWIRALTPPGERAFIISDSRFAVNYILPMPGDDMFVLYVMHNSHNTGDWNAPIYKSFTRLLSQLHDVDGFVTLTERQGLDVAQRFGARSNMFSIGNPVELPSLPAEPPTRARARFAMVCRLEPQKAVDDAIRMFRLVLAEEPDATLEIYGDGRMLGRLQDLIAELGLGASVLLKGHDPNARSSLWTATGFVVTSKFEGFPLATLESLAHGCPIVAYDVKYGLREQIEDGVCGYVVPAGDERAMADRLLAMVRDPGLVARLSKGARIAAERHDYRAFLRDWQRVLERVVELKPRRTTIRSATLSVRTLGLVPQRSAAAVVVNTERIVRRAARLGLPGGVGRAVHRAAGRAAAARNRAVGATSGAFPASPTMRFAGRLTVTGHSPASDLGEAVVTLDAVAHASTAVAPIDLDVRLKGETFHLSADFDLADVFAALGDDRSSAVRLRLRLVWHNSKWETYVKRPKGAVAAYELAFERSGDAVLWHGGR